MMTTREMEQVLKDVNVRTSTIEQILPTLATKQDLKESLLAMRQDLLAATRQDLTDAMRGLEERLRTHMGVLHEDSKSDSRLLAEHLVGLAQRLDRLERRG